MKITKDTVGFVQDLTIQDYHDSKVHYSSSVLKQALKDPRGFYDQRILGKEAPKQNMDAMNLGNFLHTLILEPEKIYDEYAIFMGASRRGREWDVFEQENKDKIIITKSQYQLGQKLLLEFNQAKVENEDQKVVTGPALFNHGVAEESLFVKIKGLLIKVRFDYRIFEKKKIVRDLKTTSSTANTVEEAAQIIRAFDYDLSAALYVDALKIQTGEDYDFHLVFLSKQDMKLNIYKVSKETLQKGREKYLQAIDNIVEWNETGIFYESKLREV